MSLESISLGGLAVVLFSTGYLFTVQVETALAVQERYAETVSWKPPSNNPEYYDDLREHRLWVFRLGGVALLVVGTLLLVVALYATFFVESFPQ